MNIKMIVMQSILRSTCFKSCTITCCMFQFLVFYSSMECFSFYSLRKRRLRCKTYKLIIIFITIAYMAYHWLGQRASYLALYYSVLGPDGAVSYDYMIIVMILLSLTTLTLFVNWLKMYSQ